MAEPFETLMEVQRHDTTLDQLRHRIETLPERTELREVQRRQAATAEALASVQAQVDDLAARQRSLEGQIAASAGRRHEIEHRMESGVVSASRDLQAMDHEVHQLEARQAHFEEEEIALLEEEEPLDLDLAEHLRVSAELLEEAARLEGAIVEAEREIRSAAEAEQGQRQELAAALPADLSQRYETLRSRLGGIGAAQLVGNHCDGCHLTLSSVELERIRRLPPDELATCPECDRILVR
jgi:uncharacterized protein